MKTVFTILLFMAAAIAQMQTVGVNETINAAKLSASEVREIITGVERSAYDTPDSWGKELRVRRVDLGSGPGLVVRGTSLLCGSTGNCQTWVFSQDEWQVGFDIRGGTHRGRLSIRAYGDARHQRLYNLRECEC